MPGLKDCIYCPFRDDPETSCVVLDSHHFRFCELINPSSPDHDPLMVCAVERLTLEPLGKWVEPPWKPPVKIDTTDRAAIEARRARKVRVRLGERVAPGRR